MRGVILFLLFFVHLNCFSQNLLIKGKVVSENNTNPLAFVNIAILGRMEGTYSNEDGIFNLYTFVNDTILFSSVGYKSKMLPVSSITISQKLTVELIEDSVNLSELIFSVKKYRGRIYQSEFGFHNSKKRVRLSTSSPGLQYATFIQNSSKTRGYVTKILLKIKSTEPNSIKLNFYSSNKDGVKGPQKNLLKKDIIINLKNRAGILKLDISEYYIDFPENGIFIGVEFMGNLDEYGVLMPKEKNVYIGSKIYFSKEDEYSNTWINFMNKKWTRDYFSASKNSNLMIGLQVEFNK